MDIVVSVDDKAGAFAVALGKFVKDVSVIVGPGAESLPVEVEQLLLSAVKNLFPSFSNYSEVKDAILAHKAQFGLALASQLNAALEG